MKPHHKVFLWRIGSAVLSSTLLAILAAVVFVFVVENTRVIATHEVEQHRTLRMSNVKIEYHDGLTETYTCDSYVLTDHRITMENAKRQTPPPAETTGGQVTIPFTAHGGVDKITIT